MITCVLSASLLASVFTSDSRITDVVVFPNHAQITREIEIQAQVGQNVVSFTDLIPILNPHSLRASTMQGARITGTQIRTVYLQEPLSESIHVLDQQIQQLNDAIAQQERAQARVLERAAFYQSIKGRLVLDMQRELADSRISVPDWQQMIDFVGDGLSDCDGELGDNALTVRELQSQLTVALNERKDYAGRQPKKMKEVIVSFDAENDGPLAIQIHYMVEASIWKPSYDVHLDRASGQVEIIGYGQVMQWTGEAWDDVHLTLAMSRPDAELAMPELTPMVASLDHDEMAQLAKEVTFLHASGQDQAQEWSKSRFKRRQDRDTFRRNLEQLARQPTKHLEKFGLNHEMIAGAMSRLVDRFAAVRYEIERRATIPFDSSPHKVVAFTAIVPSQLKYVATPALGDSVMLQGEITNTTGNPILAGSVALFVDESFVGSSSLPGAAQNEGLSFGFGPDDALIVKRRLVARTVKGPEAFRQSQVISYRYEITVENFDTRLVEVEMADQIPVSKTKEIQVEFVGSNLEHTLEPETGMLLWTLQVEPGAVTKIAYSFSVECPVNRDVHWN
jgi:uncharacterized protein (TIGR02231 family)